MTIETETSTRFTDELRIISRWAYVIASLGFVAVGAAVVFAHVTHRSSDRFYTLPVLLPSGILAAIVVACYILLIGYVHADAGRRGMSPLAWTLLAIFIPHALGIVLYFVLRKARNLSCPQCRATVEHGFCFCPCCRCRLNAVCPTCQRRLNSGDRFCPHCGQNLATPTVDSTPAPSTT